MTREEAQAAINEATDEYRAKIHDVMNRLLLIPCPPGTRVTPWMRFSDKLLEAVGIAYADAYDRGDR